ncbi:6-pyruvoyl trahydropterin synthase family protein [Gephyromycinifex aptenodytis]|uniref:6-pyruvoyl trahydropterin synthase family protein n=1 Tax=Gephyromycinifex aptenodytis TaxID=2716227 RepID=UPI00144881AD|nr:6-carboxytetrahydropterin synthase [Gephyromycinifex aptenodytis]
MYTLTVRDHVMIAHSLPDPFFGPAQGLHGATFVVEVTWNRPDLDEHGVVIDIGAATTALRAVLDDLDYRNLDEHPAFAGRLSTTEVVAAHIAQRLVENIDTAPFASVQVLLRENPDAWASYTHDLTGA